jgi:hypothetical protein
MEDPKLAEDLADSVMQPHLIEQQHTTQRLASAALTKARVLLVISLAIAGFAIYFVITNPHPVDKTDFLLVGIAAMNLFTGWSRCRDAKQSSGCVNRPTP